MQKCNSPFGQAKNKENLARHYCTASNGDQLQNNEIAVTRATKKFSFEIPSTTSDVIKSPWLYVCGTKSVLSVKLYYLLGLWLADREFIFSLLF